jgi:hypothetical protein
VLDIRPTTSASAKRRPHFRTFFAGLLSARTIPRAMPDGKIGGAYEDTRAPRYQDHSILGQAAGIAPANASPGKFRAVPIPATDRGSNAFVARHPSSAPLCDGSASDIIGTSAARADIGTETPIGRMQ